MNKYKKIAAIYFSLTFLISWGLDILRVAYANTLQLPLNNETYFLKLIQTVRLHPDQYLPITISTFIFGPLISALIVIFLFRKDLFQDILKQLSFSRLTAKWFIIANGIHIFLVTFSLVVAVVLSGFTIPTFTFLLPLYYAPLFLLYLIIFTGLAEEIGWRGIALPALQKIMSPYNASVVLGIIWAIWHLPLTIYAYQSNLGALPMVIIGLIAGTIGWSIVVSWFYNHSKSLLLTIYLHGFGNFLVSYLLLSTNLPLANIIYGFAPWVIVFFLENKFGKEFIIKSNLN